MWASGAERVEMVGARKYVDFGIARPLGMDGRIKMYI